VPHVRFPVGYCSILLTDVLCLVMCCLVMNCLQVVAEVVGAQEAGEVSIQCGCSTTKAAIQPSWGFAGPAKCTALQGSRLPADMTPLAMANRHHEQCSSPAPASLPGSYTNTVRVY
jgi:hypothetical protein